MASQPEFDHSPPGGGRNRLHFPYRGCWNSEVTYFLQGALYDVDAVIEWLLERRSADPHRLAVVGSGIGGYPTLSTCAEHRREFVAYAAHLRRVR